MSKKKQKRKSLSLKNNSPQAEQSLYANPVMSPSLYRPRTYVINEKPEEIITPWERQTQIRFARSLFATMPLISAAILNKNDIAVGNAWMPLFNGIATSDADKAWVIEAQNWLVNDFYPNVNWMGQNFSFQDTLKITGKDIDVDGGSLMLFRQTKSGLPRVELIPTDRIGARAGETVVGADGGSYKGNKIYDGIIYNDQNMPIALKLLGTKPEDDQYISLFNCQYLYEPNWTKAGHGMPRISFAVTNLMDIQDITDLLKITIKNLSRQSFIHKNKTGTAPKGPKYFQAEQTQGNANCQPVVMETVNGGATTFLNSQDGSELTPFSFESPSPNTEAFLFRVSSEAVAALGWFIELVTPSKLNGTSTRLIQDQARKLIIWRQQTLERRAKAIVQYGLAVAMQNGLISKTTNQTWMRWKFQTPGELTVDSGYDNAAQIQSYEMGLTPKAEICARRGKDWKDINKQIDIEADSLWTRATALAEKFGLTKQYAAEWLEGRDVDALFPQPETGQATPPVDNSNN